MQVSLPSSRVAPAAPVVLQPIRLAAFSTEHLAGLLVAPPAHLCVDCDGLLAPHPMGTCHFISQLLVLRGRGTRIQLCHVHPVLLRCLHSLALAASFHLNG